MDTLGEIEREIRWRRKLDGREQRRGSGGWLAVLLLVACAWLVIWLASA